MIPYITLNVFGNGLVDMPNISTSGDDVNSETHVLFLCLFEPLLTEPNNVYTHIQ